MEGMLDKNGDGFCKSWHSNREVADCFDYGRDRDDRSGSQQESASNDILDLLPSDPLRDGYKYYFHGNYWLA